MSDEKLCKQCKEFKTLNEFYIHSTNNRGKIYYRTECIKCSIFNNGKNYHNLNDDSKKFKNKKHYENNKEKISEYQYEYRETHREENIEYQKQYRKNNPEKVLESSRKSYDKNKDKRKTYKKDYYENNKNIIIDKAKQYYIENKDKKQEYNRLYREENKNSILNRSNNYLKEKYHRDINYRLHKRISKLIGKSILKNGNSILKFLSFTIYDLKNHFERQFEPWMNWNNYGSYNKTAWKNDDTSTWKWNIDHIIPRSELKFASFDDINFQKCWALENLRPYSAKQNLLDGVNRTRHKKGTK
jgi:hypothetical protein